MSELSESYHLATEEQQEAVDLLTRAEMRGFVFPPETGWVTFVADGKEFTADPRLVAANTGTLLHYVHAEDHGWSFTIFEGSEKVSDYGCEWEWEEAKVEEAALNRELVERLVRERRGDPATLQKLLHPSTEELFAAEVTAADEVADLLKLPFYSWISWRYVTIDDAVRSQVALREVP